MSVPVQGCCFGLVTVDLARGAAITERAGVTALPQPAKTPAGAAAGEQCGPFLTLAC